MKTINTILIVIIALTLNSCFSYPFYQVYQATPSEKALVNENMVAFADDNCQVSYNLWNEGGSMGFGFYNKTDQNIYLNLEESFYILNGTSNNYFKNRVYTNASNTGTSVIRPATIYGNALTSVTSETSVQFIEEKIAIIPAHTSKHFNEYSINSSIYRDCELYLTPNSKKQVLTKEFTLINSPLVFSNRLTYSIGKSGEPIKMDNEFYVSKITNLPESDVLETIDSKFCDETTSVTIWKQLSPVRFYLKYNDDGSGKKH